MTHVTHMASQSCCVKRFLSIVELQLPRSRTTCSRMSASVTADSILRMRQGCRPRNRARLRPPAEIGCAAREEKHAARRSHRSRNLGVELRNTNRAGGSPSPSTKALGAKALAHEGNLVGWQRTSQSALELYDLGTRYCQLLHLVASKETLWVLCRIIPSPKNRVIVPQPRTLIFTPQRLSTARGRIVSYIVCMLAASLFRLAWDWGFASMHRAQGPPPAAWAHAFIDTKSSYAVDVYPSRLCDFIPQSVGVGFFVGGSVDQYRFI